jgi:hypothetical protein
MSGLAMVAIIRVVGIPLILQDTVPNFSVDLLQAVKAALKTITHSKSSVNSKDPISGETLQFNEGEFWL